MTYQLTPAQTALYQEGFWAAYRVEEDVLDYLIGEHIEEFVTVVTDGGDLAFFVTCGEVVDL